jgi:hypothetical protein
MAIRLCGHNKGKRVGGEGELQKERTGEIIILRLQLGDGYEES